MSCRSVAGCRGMNIPSNSAEPITNGDAQQIRAMIERWAAAVDAGDLDGVLDNHGDDIVMFDVPPPQNGVRGGEAYRAAWPGFLDWQQHGGVFELVSLEVTAGTDVAFAHALLRCGTHDDLDRHPEQRLRLTIGLRKQDERWLIIHEHHSFPDTSALTDAAGEASRWSAGPEEPGSFARPQALNYQHDLESAWTP